MTTEIEKVKAVLGNLDGHGIYVVENIQKSLDSQGLPVKLGKGWKVSEKFVKEVEMSGGWLKISVGTPIIDGGQVVNALMGYYGVKNPDSFMGRGKQYWSDLECLMAALVERSRATP